MSCPERDPLADDPLRKLIQSLMEVHPPPRPILGYSYVPRFINSPPVEMTKALISGVDCDEVYPGIYIGDEGAARNKEFLMAIGITHVLNSAEGSGFGQVSTGSAYYAGTGIKYLGFKLIDMPSTRIMNHFEEGVRFIDSALSSSNGKILSHCLMGMSRSSTFVIAYLMTKRGMSVEDALRSIRHQRDCRPNDGFLVQLLQYQKHLAK